MDSALFLYAGAKNHLLEDKKSLSSGPTTLAMAWDSECVWLEVHLSA
jgi:hypothetical protein